MLDVKVVTTFREEEVRWWLRGALGLLDASGCFWVMFYFLTCVVTWLCSLLKVHWTIQVRFVHFSYLCYASIKRYSELAHLWYSSLLNIFNLSVSCPGEPFGEAHMAVFRRSSEASNSHTSELQVAIWAVTRDCSQADTLTWPTSEPERV